MVKQPALSGLIGQKVRQLGTNLPLKQALLLAQWRIAVEYLVKAIFGWASTVCKERSWVGFVSDHTP